MAKRGPRLFEKFRSGDQFHWGRFLGAIAHLVAIASVVIAASVYYPLKAQLANRDPGFSEDAIRVRQLLLEALDYYVRYQHYYHEVYGRYSRELVNLGVPTELSQGTLAEVQRYYEISVLDASPKRLLLLATARPNVPASLGLGRDRVTIDGHYRLNGNFAMPMLSRKYLTMEADRALQLYLRNRQLELGLAKEYWRFEPRRDDGRAKWVAVGLRGPALGGQRSAIFGGGEAENRGLASIFTQVRRHLAARAPQSRPSPQAAASERGGREFGLMDLHFLLADSRFAQHVHWRERGVYAADWDALDTVSSFRILERVRASSNLELEPIEITPEGYNLRVKGTSGVFIGELFTMNEAGELKQIRYTDVLVKELSQTRGILQNSFGFQISEVPQDEAAITEEKTAKKVKRGPSAEVP